MTTDYGPAPEASLERVEWRVDGKPTEGDSPRARFVPYIDARDVAALLDQWVGPLNWRSSFEETVIGGKAAMWGIVEVRDPATGEWVAKRDLGVPSNFEPAKGLVSDAFKRAGCVQWGVGRNVYDLPSIWAPCRIVRGKDGKPAAAADPAKTMPAILAELKKQGFQATGGRATGEDPTADPETGASPLPTERQPTDLVTKEDMDHLATVMADLTDQERERIKAERTAAGMSIKPGQFNVGTLRWLVQRAQELLVLREQAAQLQQEAPPANLVGVIAQGNDGQAADADHPPAPPSPPADAGAARRAAGGAKLATKQQRDAAAKALAQLSPEAQAEVTAWAEGAGHKLGDQLAADSYQAVMTAISNVKRKGAAPSGPPRRPRPPQAAPKPPPAPSKAPDPAEVRRELRRTQWRALNDAVEALGVTETWPMLMEELVGAAVVEEGAPLNAVAAAFIELGDGWDDWVREMVEQYQGVVEEMGKPFEEPPKEQGEAAADATPDLDDVDF